MSKYEGHTPGPWEWVADRYHGGYSGLFSTDDQPIVVPQSENAGDYGAAWFGTDADYYGETALEAADAHLIADAPMLLQQRDELLAMIDRLIDTTTDLQYECNSHTYGIISSCVADAAELVTRIRVEDMIGNVRAKGFYSDEDDVFTDGEEGTE